MPPGSCDSLEVNVRASIPAPGSWLPNPPGFQGRSPWLDLFSDSGDLNRSQIAPDGYVSSASACHMPTLSMHLSSGSVERPADSGIPARGYPPLGVFGRAVSHFIRKSNLPCSTPFYRHEETHTHHISMDLTGAPLHRKAKACQQAAVSRTKTLEMPRIVLPAHLRTLRDLMLPPGTAGNLTSDAHLAAPAIAHGAELCSTDNAFARFARLKWRNPLA
jgi:hypothetical protein